MMALEKRQLPQHEEAEMALLAAILANNRSYERVAGYLRGEHFANELHARIFDICAELIGRGDPADAITVRAGLQDSPELGRYVASLAGAVVTFFNADNYGRTILDRWQRRQVIALAEDLAETARDTEVTADEVVAGVVQECHRLLSAGASGSASRGDVLANVAASLDRELECYSTGLPSLDNAMGGGLYASKLYGIAGRKKAGKSLLLGTISYNLNEQGVPHAYICLEMSDEEIEHRHIGRALGFNSLAFLNKQERSKPEFKERVREYVNSRPPQAVRYIKKPGASFDDIKRIIVGEVYRHKLRGIVVDYLQLIGGRPPGRSYSEHLDIVSQWLADTARQLGVFVLVAAQLNQDSDNMNIRHGEGLRLACDQMYALHEILDERKQDTGGRWLDCWDSRYTLRVHIGTSSKPGLVICKTAGPYLKEVDQEVYRATGWAQ